LINEFSSATGWNGGHKRSLSGRVATVFHPNRVGFNHISIQKGNSGNDKVPIQSVLASQIMGTGWAMP
jgi:hypothetical protein